MSKKLLYNSFSSNPYSADFVINFVHFDISFCLAISRNGSIKLFNLSHFFLTGQNPKRPIYGTLAGRGPMDILHHTVCMSDNVSIMHSYIKTKTT